MTSLDPDALALLRHKDVSSGLIEDIAPELFGGTLVAQDGIAHRQAREIIALLANQAPQTGALRAQCQSYPRG